MTQSVGEQPSRPPAERDPAPTAPASPAAVTGLTLPANEQHAPRPLTPHALRQSWLEPRVRSWVLASVTLGVLAVYLLVSQFIDYYRDERLFQKGTKVDALLVRVESSMNKGQRFYNDPVRDVDMRYTFGGREQVFKGYLTSYDAGWLVVGSTIPIHVDPSDPERYTARQHPATIMPHLVAGLSLLPLIGITVGIAAWRRRKLLHLWRRGELLPAVVIRTSGVAVAPSARAVECTATDSDDTDIRRAFLPARRGQPLPDRGDLVWLIVSADRKGPAIAADWFSSRTA